MAGLTVRELLDGKGKRQFSYVQIPSEDPAAAGMDMIGTGFIPERYALRDEFRTLDCGAQSI